MRRLLLFGLAAVVLGFIVLFVVSLAVPMRSWRTGEGRMPPVALDAPGAHNVEAQRIWIDADAACGEGPRIDVDDCWAILAATKMPGTEIVGVSSVFGNAPHGAVERITKSLADRVGLSDHFYPGAAEPLSDQSPTTSVQEALTKALEDGPLTVLALGPLTNVAHVLQTRPDLGRNVTGIVAVMGQRPRHLFHPIEGGQSKMFLGHGPIFRDFNVAKDIEAVRIVVDARVPLTLIPYEAARMVMITKADVDRLEAQSGASAWVASRSRAWLAFWTDDIGVDGFYPFDLLAAVYLRRPDMFRCAAVPISVERQPWFWRWFLGREGLFVASEEDAANTRATYCAEATTGTHDTAMALLLGSG